MDIGIKNHIPVSFESWRWKSGTAGFVFHFADLGPWKVQTLQMTPLICPKARHCRC